MACDSRLGKMMIPRHADGAVISALPKTYAHPRGNRVGMAEAYSRQDRTPIYIEQSERPALGRFTPKGFYGDSDPVTDTINIRHPKDSGANNISDTMRHELVHQALLPLSKSGDLPMDEYFSGRFLGERKPTDLGDILRGAWNKSQRAGDAENELPAYMAIHNQSELDVSPEVRERYMKALDAWVREKGYPSAADRVDKLSKTRNAYNSLVPHHADGAVVAPQQSTWERLWKAIMGREALKRAENPTAPPPMTPPASDNTDYVRKAAEEAGKRNEEEKLKKKQ